MFIYYYELWMNGHFEDDVRHTWGLMKWTLCDSMIPIWLKGKFYKTGEISFFFCIIQTAGQRIEKKCCMW